MLLGGSLAVVIGLVGVLGGADPRQAHSREPDRASCEPTTDRRGPLVDLDVDLAGGPSDNELGRLVGLAAGAGADVVSTTVSFADLAPVEDGTTDWTSLDRLAAATDAAGLELRVQVHGAPGWALNPLKPGGPERAPQGTWELGQWATLVGELAGRYRDRLDYLEAWDAPDDPAVWSTGPDPAAYAGLLRTTYAAAKAADPGIQVVTGGLSGADLGYLDGLYAALDTTPGEARPFDLVGVQAFDGDRSPGADLVVPADSGPTARLALAGGDDSLIGVRDVHALMVEHGDAAKDVYVTGYGYRTESWLGAAPVADTRRADYLTEAFEVATCSSAVRALSWYFQPSAEHDASWTLLDDSLMPNQTYRALVAWSERVAALRGEAVTR